MIGHGNGRISCVPACSLRADEMRKHVESNKGLKSRSTSQSSFTLIEVLVAMAIFIILLAILFTIINQVANVMRQSTRQIEAFQSARLGFDLMTHSVGQATLNTYLDYDSSLFPTNYLRKSDLDFVITAAGSTVPSGTVPGTAGAGQGIFFQAPLNYVTNVSSYSGLEALLNTDGFYISFTTNIGVPSYVKNASNPYRYRLMQMLVPSENNEIYTATGDAWFTDPNLQNYGVPVADNIIALIVRPQDPSTSPPTDITSDYSYDADSNATVYPQAPTAKQLPPVLQVTMVAIDEASAKRLATGSSTPPTVISTALSGKFLTSANYLTDLALLEQQLTAAHIVYKVFTSNVPIRESKWTK